MFPQGQTAILLKTSWLLYRLETKKLGEKVVLPMRRAVEEHQATLNRPSFSFGGVLNAGCPSLAISFSVPFDTEGAPFFVESAVLILRSEQRVGGGNLNSSCRSPVS